MNIKVNVKNYSFYRFFMLLIYNNFYLTNILYYIYYKKKDDIYRISILRLRDDIDLKF